MTDQTKQIPAVLELEEGTYFWCACGKSANQPFCNGAHKGSSFGPKTFEVKQHSKLAICQCKETKNPPYCDGSHAKTK